MFIWEQEEDLNFTQKFDQVLPDLSVRFSVDQLNKRRNYYGHPKQLFEDSEIRQTAVGFIDLSIAAWPDLFGHTRAPIVHPALASAPGATGLLQQMAVLRQKDQQIQQLARRIQELETSERPQPGEPVREPFQTGAQAIPWRALVFGILLLLPLLLLVGFAGYHWRQQPIIWYWAAISTILSLVLGFFAMRHLWRFLRSVGLRRLVAAVSVGLVLATLTMIPFAPRGIDLPYKAGAALARVLTFVEQAVGGVASGISSLGANLAHAVAPTTSLPTVVPMATMEPTRAPWTATPVGAATALQTSQPTALPVTPTASAQPTSTPRPPTVQPVGITIGARVRVKTDGAALMSRAEPGKDKTVIARFDNGSELTVLEGPVTADGITWWKVQGQAGTGWSAADFLEPAKIP